MSTVIRLLAVLALASLGANSQFSPPFRFDGFPPPEPTRSTSSSSSSPSNSDSSFDSSNNSNNNSNNSSGQPLIWQPLRATFRPLNRPASPAPAPPPPPPPPPTPPSPPAPPVPLALSLGTEPISSSSSLSPTSDFSSDSGSSSSTRFGFSSFSGNGNGNGDLSTTGLASDLTTGNGNGNSFGPTPAPASSRDLLDSEDQPTRVPLNRFRPTKAPSSDPQTQPSQSGSSSSLFPSASRSQNLTLLSSFPLPNNNNNKRMKHISGECLECICEASTNCNPNSRCQTSDVRHTRCGMFLISYDQWLETGLSRELVTAEALAQDAAADERAFYECVTSRDCAERLLTIYAHKHAKDCDKDGRIDCYDMAAVHQGGMDGCQSETLLDSQYWSDFNACYGFGRRRR